MITSKMLYMIQDERELAYMYGGPDAAYCIGGREIRMPVPGGIKVFIDRDTISQQNLAAKPTQINIEQVMSNMNERMSSIEKIVNELAAKIKEEPSNDKSKGNGGRNSF